MEIKYNDTTNKIDTCNNQIMSDFENMSASEQMPDREQKRPT